MGRAGPDWAARNSAGGPARIDEEVRLRGLKREREKLQDDQLDGQGARGAFRRTRELDSTQRQLLGY